jgi:serine/threonine protein kinase
MDVILADFGFVSLISAEGFRKPVGTLQYLTPEIWNSSTNRYSHKMYILSLDHLV